MIAVKWQTPCFPLKTASATEHKKHYQTLGNAFNGVIQRCT